MYALNWKIAIQIWWIQWQLINEFNYEAIFSYSFFFSKKAIACLHQCDSNFSFSPSEIGIRKLNLLRGANALTFDNDICLDAPINQSLCMESICFVSVLIHILPSDSNRLKTDRKCNSSPTKRGKYSWQKKKINQIDGKNCVVSKWAHNCRVAASHLVTTVQLLTLNECISVCVCVCSRSLCTKMPIHFSTVDVVAPQLCRIH